MTAAASSPPPPGTGRLRLDPAGLACLCLVACLGLQACRSTPQPPPQPSGVLEAERLARQAARLQAEESWTAAADWWQRAGRQYRLLHREADAALADHNQAVARKAMGQPARALELLEAAARSNQRLHLTNAWWRNQIALLQIETETHPEPTEDRLDRLTSRLRELDGDPALLALYHHEEARRRTRQDRLIEALQAIALAEKEFQAAGDPLGRAALTLTRARILEKQQDLQAARSAWRTALRSFEALGHPRGIALALAGLGSSLARSPAPEDQERAFEILTQALENLSALRLSAEAEAVAATRQRLETPPRSRNRTVPP